MDLTEAKKSIRKWVVNELDPDEGRYCIFKVNSRTGKANVQSAGQKKSRWVKVEHLSRVD